MRHFYHQNNISEYFFDTTKKKWCYDYKISVVIPTRNRTSLLKECISSLIYNASENILVEYIFIVDFDDTETINVLRSLDNNFKFHCNDTGDELCSMSIVMVNRSTFMQRDYNNVGANIAKGDLIFILNDDCIIETKNWNVKLFEFYMKNKPEDDIMLIGCRDNTHDGMSLSGNGHKRSIESFGACFPVVTKTFTKIFNGVFPPEVKMWTADTLLHRIFAKLNRFYYCDSIYVDHNTYHAGTREKDEINNYVHNCSDQVFPPGDMNQYIKVIHGYLKETNTNPTILTKKTEYEYNLK